VPAGNRFGIDTPDGIRQGSGLASGSAPSGTATPNWINVKSQGAQGNGVADDTAAIQRAINAIPAQGGTVYFPAGQYKISSTLTIGNGSSGAISTIGNNLRLLGQGGPTNIAFGDSKAGVALVWAGGASIMLNVLGPISGVGIDGFYFDAAGLANTCLRVDHSDRSNYTKIECINFLTEGIIQTAYPAPTGFNNGSNGNLFKFVYVTQITSVVTGMRIGENTLGSFPNLDPASNFYEDLAIFCSVGGSIALQTRYCDSEMFVNCSLNATIPHDVVVVGSVFPQNLVFTNGNNLPRLDTITGAANNGGGLIRITTTPAHGRRTGDWVSVISVGGVPNATGVWKITVISGTTYDLQGSTFGGAYTSGGTAQGNPIQETTGTWAPIVQASGGVRWDGVNMANSLGYWSCPQPAITSVAGTTSSNVNFGPQPRDVVLATAAAGTLVNSAASDVATYTYTLPAGILNFVGAELRVRCNGIYTSTTAVTWVFRLKVGGTNFVSASIAGPLTATNLPFVVIGGLLTRTTGASGVVAISNEMAAMALVSPTIGASGNTTLTLDLTGKLVIEADLNIASGTPANNGTGQAFILEVAYARATA
jgi:hypothetical protein